MKCRHNRHCQGIFGPKPNKNGDIADCPKNTDDNCNIIPKPAKDVKIKAWVEGDIKGDNFTIYTHKRNAIRWHRSMVECEIVITAANWKKIKGGK